jgi:hypothetical protein
MSSAGIFFATSASRPRADVAYCINALARRIAKTHNWTVKSVLHFHPDSRLMENLDLGIGKHDPAM